MFFAWSCSVKNVFLKFLQHSQGNTGGGRLHHRCLPQNFTIFFKSTYCLGFYANCPRGNFRPTLKLTLIQTLILTGRQFSPKDGGGASVLIPSFRTAASGATILLLPKVFPRAFFNGLLTTDANTSCTVYVMF